jgi:DNA repair protein RadC
MHEGHRERLRTKFEKFGPDALYDHELLELLLFYSIPRVNTNTLSHDLLSRFGSLEGVLEADTCALCQVDGIGKTSAVLIKLAAALARPKGKRRSLRGVRLNTYSDATKYILKFYDGESTEKLGIILLDATGRVIDTKWLGGKDSAFTPASLATIIREAVSHNARSVILCHNHPRGIAIPSSEDINATSTVNQALRYAQIKLLEHFVVAGERATPIMHGESVSEIESPIF